MSRNSNIRFVIADSLYGLHGPGGGVQQLHAGRVGHILRQKFPGRGVHRLTNQTAEHDLSSREISGNYHMCKKQFVLPAGVLQVFSCGYFIDEPP